MIVSRKLLVFALAALSSACGGPSLQYVKKPAASPLKGQKEVAVAVTYDGLMIGAKGFDQYIAEKQAKAEAGKDESAAKWSEWRETWRRETASLISQAVQGTGATVKEIATPRDARSGIVVHVNVESIEPGYYAVVAAGPSETRVRVRVFDARRPGDVLYEITGSAQHGGYTIGGRVGDDMTSLASALGEALRAELQ